MFHVTQIWLRQKAIDFNKNQIDKLIKTYSF